MSLLGYEHVLMFIENGEKRHIILGEADPKLTPQETIVISGYLYECTKINREFSTAIGCLTITYDLQQVI